MRNPQATRTRVRVSGRLTGTFNADGIYGNFAGRSASRGIAKQSFDLGMSPANYIYFYLSLIRCLLDMLTPLDQPLDKLKDLSAEKMSGDSFFPLFTSKLILLFLKKTQ